MTDTNDQGDDSARGGHMSVQDRRTPTRRDLRAAGVGRRARPHRRRMAVSLVLVLAAASLATAGSWAAWVVQGTNTGNTFTTGTILLSDNQGGQAGSATSSGTALFTVTGMSPGSAATEKCIGVKYTGTASGMTLGAALSGADQATLGPQLTMDVATYVAGSVTTDGTNLNSGSCASYPGGGSTIGTQGATLAAWAAGGAYTIASPPTETWYKFTISGLPAGASSCATYCNKTITLALTWTLTAT